MAELLSGFYERGESEYQASDVPERVYLFFPLACGTFHALFTPQVTLKDRTIFFKQGLEGIAFLHDKGVMHRAIKPANLAVKQFDPPSAMIIDFGSAAQEEFCFDNPGTIPYLAPEIDYGSKHGRTVDIWSYGIVGLELFELRKPATASTIRVDSRAYDNNRANLEAICKNNTSVIENVILRMFQWRPSERSSAADALLHSSLEHVNTKAESS